MKTKKILSSKYIIRKRKKIYFLSLFFQNFKINLNDLRSNLNEKTRIKFVKKRKTLTFNWRLPFHDKKKSFGTMFLNVMKKTR